MMLRLALDQALQRYSGPLGPSPSPSLARNCGARRAISFSARCSLLSKPHSPPPARPRAPPEILLWSPLPPLRPRPYPRYHLRLIPPALRLPLSSFRAASSSQPLPLFYFRHGHPLRVPPLGCWHAAPHGHSDA